jgi:hypothetical protein
MAESSFYQNLKIQHGAIDFCLIHSENIYFWVMIYQNFADDFTSIHQLFIINYHQKRNESNLSTKSDDFSKKKEGLGKVMGNGIF